RPIDEFTTNQYYVENTNVLCTEITTSDGTYRITDFAPRFRQYERYFKPLTLIRKIEPLNGTPRIRVSCKPVSNYGRHTFPKFRGSNHVEFSNGVEQMRLTTNVPISHFFSEDTFVLSETKYLVLTYGLPLEAPLARTVEHFLRETVNYWRTWIKLATIAP